MNHGEQIRTLMLKAHKSHKSVNHDIQKMSIEMSKDSIALMLECLDADGDMFKRTYTTAVNGSISDALNLLKNNF